jgi:hypothetical protein
MGFEVERGHGDDLATLFGAQVMRLPAAAGADRAAILERLEETVGGEGIVGPAQLRLGAGAGIPSGLPDVGQAVMQGDGDLTLRHRR